MSYIYIYIYIYDLNSIFDVSSQMHQANYVHMYTSTTMLPCSCIVGKSKDHESMISPSPSYHGVDDLGRHHFD